MRTFYISSKKNLSEFFGLKNRLVLLKPKLVGLRRGNIVDPLMFKHNGLRRDNMAASQMVRDADTHLTPPPP